MTDKQVLELLVKIEWTKSDSPHAKSGYSGGYEISKIKGAKGHTIMEGYHSPNFTMSRKDVINKVRDYYTRYFEGKYHVLVKTEVTRDDRNPRMDNFF